MEGNTKNILLVDDDEDILKTLQEHLESVGFSVMTAQNTDQACRQFKKGQVDIIITDYMMSDSDGIDLIERIRELSKDTPIMILSGYGEKLMAKYERLEAVVVVEKPYEMTALQELIARMV